MTEAQNEMAVPPEQSAAMEMARQTAAFKGGANWFYWIAGLSVANSLISLFQGGWGFIFGLGITQIVDAIAAVILEEQGDAAGLIRIIALGTSVFFSGFFALFGWLTNRGQGWAFILGMTLYLLDGLLMLLRAGLDGAGVPRLRPVLHVPRLHGPAPAESHRPARRGARRPRIGPDA